MDKQHSGEMSEALCCLMDGELEDNQTQFLLRRMDHDEGLRQRWARYHQARSVIQDVHSGAKSNAAPGALEGFAAGVAAAIDAEAVPTLSSHEQNNPPRPARRWLQPVAGIAVAASVAVVAFNAWQPQSSVPSTQPPVQALLSQNVEDPTGEFEGRVVSKPSNIATQAAAGGGSETHQRYLIRHAQVSTAGHRLPLIYVVSDSSAKPTPADDAQDKAADLKQPAAPVTQP